MSFRGSVRAYAMAVFGRRGRHRNKPISTPDTMNKALATYQATVKRARKKYEAASRRGWASSEHHRQAGIAYDTAWLAAGDAYDAAVRKLTHKRDA